MQPAVARATRLGRLLAIAVIIGWSLLPQTSVEADSVILKDGRRLDGLITLQDRNSVRLATPTGEITIPKGQIRRITYGPNTAGRAAAKREKPRPARATVTQRRRVAEDRRRPALIRFRDRSRASSESARAALEKAGAEDQLERRRRAKARRDLIDWRSAANDSEKAVLTRLSNVRRLVEIARHSREAERVASRSMQDRRHLAAFAGAAHASQSAAQGRMDVAAFAARARAAGHEADVALQGQRQARESRLAHARFVNLLYPGLGHLHLSETGKAAGWGLTFAGTVLGTFVAYRQMRAAETQYNEVAVPAASLLGLGAPGLAANFWYFGQRRAEVLQAQRRMRVGIALAALVWAGSQVHLRMGPDSPQTGGDGARLQSAVTPRFDVHFTWAM